MSPGPLQRLKPYFKTRPRAGAQPRQPAQSAQATPQSAQPAASPAQAAPPAAAPPATPPQAVVPPVDASALKQRREELAGRFSELQSDLGGLVYEMAIRDHFRLDVLVRRAAELQAVDSELSSVEQRLGIATAAPATTSCQSCGAAVQLGAQYCGRCGSSLAQSASGARAQQPSASQPAAAGPASNSSPQPSAAQRAPAVTEPRPAADQARSTSGGSR